MTVDILAGFVSALIVAVVWLSRQLAKANERISRLEGRLNGRREE